MDGSTIVYGKSFPLVISPRSNAGVVNHVLLQEYLIKNNEKILKVASEYGAVMFKGFEVLSGEEFASVLYKSGLKEM